MKFTQSLDGKRRATVRIERRVSAEDIRDYLCAEVATFYSVEEFEAMGRTQTEKMLRDALAGHDPQSVWEWRNGVADDAELDRIAREKIAEYWPESGGVHSD